MKTLFIDNHYRDINIILFEDGKIIRHELFAEKHNNSAYLFPLIVETLKNVYIDDIIVVNGPGSFTGVRLGVTIAKTFAYLLNLSIRTVTSLECLAISSENKNVAISDNNGYYIGLFNEDMSLKQDYEYVKEINTQEICTMVELDYEKIYNFAKRKEIIQPHFVNPIYIKKIGVEK